MVIVDGTRDITGTEQESICVRYVNNNMLPQEVFLGMYEATDTTGEALCRIIGDVLLRFNLPLSSLRGQTYDGASSMSGQYTGCQALVKQKNPLALYVHCGAHCINLVMETVATCNPLLRDAIQWVHEVGTMMSQSGKFKAAFVRNVSELHENIRMLRPLCPTRWVVRVSAIRSLLAQYDAVLETLEEFGTNKSSTADAKTRASGLFDRFTKGNTLLLLSLALPIFELLENLCTALQGRQSSVCGMLNAVKQTTDGLKTVRSDERFVALFDAAQQEAQKLNIEDITLPRQSRLPRKLNIGYSGQHVFENAADYFKPIYCSIIDTAVHSLAIRFDQQSFTAVSALEDCILNGKLTDVIQSYPELDVSRLAIQLPMFRSSYKYTTVGEAVAVLQSSEAEVQQLFSEVIKVLRCLLVLPATSCEAERTFSSLRRLKTYLRSTMTQKRLNSVAVCNVHQKVLMSVSIEDIMTDFISLHSGRQRTFGAAAR